MAEYLYSRLSNTGNSLNVQLNYTNMTQQMKVIEDAMLRAEGLSREPARESAKDREQRELQELIADMSDDLIAKAKSEGLTQDERLNLVTEKVEALISVMGQGVTSVDKFRKDMGLPERVTVDPILCATCGAPWADKASQNVWGRPTGRSEFNIKADDGREQNFCSLGCKSWAVMEAERVDENYVRKSIGLPEKPQRAKPVKAKSPGKKPSDRKRKGEKPQDTNWPVDPPFKGLASRFSIIDEI